MAKSVVAITCGKCKSKYRTKLKRTMCISVDDSMQKTMRFVRIDWFGYRSGFALAWLKLRPTSTK